MKTNNDKITFEEALKILNIEDYEERIFNSNSHGELFHLHDYIIIAQALIEAKGDANKFRKWFEHVVKWAEDNWERPESIFQHIVKCMKESSRKEKNEMSKKKQTKNNRKTVTITDKDSHGDDEAFGEWFTCPRCDESLIAPYFKYCPRCGRKIRWKLTEEATSITKR